MTELVRMEGVDKRFPGVHALKAVDFDLRAGEVHALMGENGAGKSTLMKCLSGVYQPDGGRILIDGAEVALPSPRAATPGKRLLMFFFSRSFCEFLFFPDRLILCGH